MNVSEIEKLRGAFHNALLGSILSFVDWKDKKTKEVFPASSIGDNGQRLSREIGLQVTRRVAAHAQHFPKAAGQTAGSKFEEIALSFIQGALDTLSDVHGTKYYAHKGGNIGQFAQYAHLAHLQEIAAQDRTFKVTAGADYLISPDIVVYRDPLSLSKINEKQLVVGEQYATRTPLIRRSNLSPPILQASISCKWTIRSDRVQNARTEGLNLQKNRKGRIPNICVLTAEPLPSRIQSVALGTGEIDCVYHFALNELVETLREMRDDSENASGAYELLTVLLDGNRLRDISDLPFDLIS